MMITLHQITCYHCDAFSPIFDGALYTPKDIRAELKKEGWRRIQPKDSFSIPGPVPAVRGQSHEKEGRMKALIFASLTEGRAEITPEARVLSVAAHAIGAMDAVARHLMANPDADQAPMLAATMVRLFTQIRELYLEAASNPYNEIFATAETLRLSDVCTVTTEVVQ